jgi:hypothetical protein
VADAVGISADDVRGVLIALGPVVGSARAMSGAEKAMQAITAAQRGWLAPMRPARLNAAATCR